MRKVKSRFMQFAFYDKTGIKKYLEQQAKKGWMLEDFHKSDWIFRRSEPKKLRFSVTYFPEVSFFDPEPTDEQKYFQDFCAHTGWQLVATNAQMQIFYNESEDPVPIDTDASLEIANIHKSVKKHYLSGFLLAWILIFLCGGLYIHQLLSDPFLILLSNIPVFALLILVLISIVYLIEIIEYFIWYRKAKAAAKQGVSFVETKEHSGFYFALLWFVLATYVLMIFTFFGSAIVETAIGFVCPIFVIAGIVSGVSAGIKKRKISVLANRAAMNIVFHILPCILSFSVFFVNITGLNQTSKKASEHERGYAVNMYNDELPLYVEDLTDIRYDGYSCSLITKESIFLIQSDIFQRPLLGNESDILKLEYTITKVKTPLLYDWFLRELMKSRIDWFSFYRQPEFKPIDTVEWNANDAYQLYSDDDPYDIFLLCYDDRIIEIRSGWELTATQKAIISEKLSADF